MERIISPRLLQIRRASLLEEGAGRKLTVSQKVQRRPVFVSGFTPQQTEEIKRCIEGAAKETGLDTPLTELFDPIRSGHYGPPKTFPYAHFRTYELSNRNPKVTSPNIPAINVSIKTTPGHPVQERFKQAAKKALEPFGTITTNADLLELTPPGIDKGQRIRLFQSNPKMLLYWLDMLGVRNLDQLKQLKLLISDVDGTLVEGNTSYINPATMQEFFAKNGRLICLSGSIPHVLMTRFTRSGLLNPSNFQKTILIGYGSAAGMLINKAGNLIPLRTVPFLPKQNPNASVMLAYLQDPNGFWQNNVIYMGDEPHPPCNDAPAFAVLGDRAISVEQGHTQATQRLLTQINQLNGEQPFSVVNRIRLRS